jgi:hypothetical protein
MSSNWGRLESLVDGLKKEIQRTTQPRIASIAQNVADVEVDLLKQKNANNDADFTRLDSAIRGLWTEIERQPIGPDSNFGWGVRMGMAAIAAVIIGTGLMLWALIGRSPNGALMTVDGVRPIITLAAIISTVGFGGGLVFSALFSTDASFEVRFRMAREIFLVFSSVFATVVGFHFATGTSGVPPPTSTPFAVTAMREIGTKLIVSIEGGSPPYTVEGDFDGVKTEPITGSSPVPVDVSKVGYGKPFSAGEITVADSAKSKPIKLTLKNLTLQKDADLPIVLLPATAASSGASTQRQGAAVPTAPASGIAVQQPAAPASSRIADPRLTPAAPASTPAPTPAPTR